MLGAEEVVVVAVALALVVLFEVLLLEVRLAVEDGAEWDVRLE